MLTFSTLLSDLQAQDPTLPLVFVTNEGEIGAGYHVTELRHSLSTGIDCGGNIETWQETRLQLQDSKGATHMSVGKFCGIVQKSISSLPELGEAPLQVEFGHGNKGLATMSLSAAEVIEEKVVLRLSDASAICKPAQRTKKVVGKDDGCCTSADSSTAKSSCCPPAAPNAKASACCT